MIETNSGPRHGTPRTMLPLKCGRESLARVSAPRLATGPDKRQKAKWQISGAAASSRLSGSCRTLGLYELTDQLRCSTVYALSARRLSGFCAGGRKSEFRPHAHISLTGRRAGTTCGGGRVRYQRDFAGGRSRVCAEVPKWRQRFDSGRGDRGPMRCGTVRIRLLGR